MREQKRTPEARIWYNKTKIRVWW